MKNFSTLSLFLLINITVNGQLLFDASSLPAAGTVHRYNEGLANTFPSGASGSSWSFTPMPMFVNDSSRYTYKSIAETPEAQYFPEANMVKERILIQNSFGSVYRDTLLYFYRYDNSGLYYHGLCQPGQAPDYPYLGETIELPFPLSNGSFDEISDFVEFTYTSGADSIMQRSYITRTYDVTAEGALTVAGNTHQVLALLFTYESIDSVFTFSQATNAWIFDFTSDNVSEKESFYSPAMGTAVLTGEFYPSEGPGWTIAYLTNPPVATGISDAEQDAAIVYPNPSNDVFHVNTGTAGKFNCRIFDLNGRLVQEEMVSSMFFTTDALPTGDYMMLLESLDGKLSFSRKLVVAK